MYVFVKKGKNKNKFFSKRARIVFEIMRVLRSIYQTI